MDDATIAAHPQAPAAALARIVSQRPDLRPVVAANPAAQPALLEWLAALRDPAVDAALASRSASAQQVAPPAPVSWAPEPTTLTSGWAPQAAPGRTAFAQAAYTRPDPAVQDISYQGEPPRSRRGLWIGLVATAVVLVGGGALAAYLMVFSKLDGAPTPEAAVTQLIEGVAHKDGIAVYGAISPSEIEGLSPVLSAQTGTPDDEETRKKLLTVLDALDVDLAGLDVEVEPIGEGLAKVSVVAGTLSVDGDAKEIVDALADVYEPAMGGLESLTPGGTAEMWDQATVELDKALPWSVDAKDLAWDVRGGAQRPFLVAVEEGGSWYVSPLMTLGELVNVETGGERGAMPDRSSQTGAATAEAAGTQFATATAALFGGDTGPMVAALPPAEARFFSVYVQAWLDDTDGHTGNPTVDEASFVPTPIDDDRTRLAIGRVALGGEYPAVFEGVCVTDKTSGQKVCADSSPLGEQLGFDELGLVAVHADRGWNVSLLATFADWSSIVGSHLKELQDSGELADGTWLRDLVLGSGFGDYPSPNEFGERDRGEVGDESDAFDMGGYTFDDEGNLLNPNGVVIEQWSVDEKGNLVDVDGNVLWAQPSTSDY
ncbi:variant leucine-rich repeat-containing protein [Cellulomonas rhizosphaerae]|uniref:Leucine rich repeat variant domain-containing protein n=1 Tax=Cellulomonas rhizosphaerae TaxID=2293719 RepID=A0A413RPB0_9CELL|nr:hypothetical protein [Cellulomonas rhizosphaerae]RHA43741.1 hypothetical protein D1825_04850 [Cellulomonas rhizosphaerae]